MSAHPDTTTDQAAREIVITRVFDAPREVVFNAFTDPQVVPQWWGPKGFSITTETMDVRPGGVWRFVMHGPDGTDYQNNIVYDEILEPERLVYSNRSDEKDDPHAFNSTVTFDDRDGKTEVTMRMRLATAEARDQVAEYAIEGGNQTLDRLEELLATR